MSWIDNPIFICGHRKCGTTLMVCLLDNHPQLSVIPTDSGFFYAYYPLCEQMKWSKEEKIKRIMDWCITPFPNELIRCGVDIKERADVLERLSHAFKFYCGREVDLIADKLLLCLARSYREINGPGKKVGWVEKTTSSEIYAHSIKKWFPDARFIHIVRDPRDNWASLKSGWEKRYKNSNDDIRRLMQSMIERGTIGFEMAHRNRYLLGSNYLVLRYEDLVQGSRETMNLVCQFLGIEWNDCLLVPSMLGNPWPGNNFDREWQGISAGSIGRWQDGLVYDEIALIEFYFYGHMISHRYVPYFSEYDIRKDNAATAQYAWHNYAQVYSVDKEKYKE